MADLALLRDEHAERQRLLVAGQARREPEQSVAGRLPHRQVLLVPHPVALAIHPESLQRYKQAFIYKCIKIHTHKMMDHFLYLMVVFYRVRSIHIIISVAKATFPGRSQQCMLDITIHES